jgi:phosphoribosylformimino-5-aminoimidazole carboxamide ribotide isomerase
MNGKVVHAIKGNRDSYRPLNTNLSTSSDPIDVISGFNARFDFDELYVAELDGIMKGQVNFSLLTKICNTNSMSVMIDAGFRNSQSVREIIRTGCSAVIVSTESLERISSLSKIIKASGEIPTIISIDLIDGKVVSKCTDLRGLLPSDAAKVLEKCGVSQMILIDISRVGSENGVNIETVREVFDTVKVPLIVGGGIRSKHEIISLSELGIKGVLISTALHKGFLNREDLDIIRKRK